MTTITQTTYDPLYEQWQKELRAREARVRDSKLFVNKPFLKAMARFHNARVIEIISAPSTSSCGGIISAHIPSFFCTKELETFEFWGHLMPVYEEADGSWTFESPLAYFPYYARHYFKEHGQAEALVKLEGEINTILDEVADGFTGVVQENKYGQRHLHANAKDADEALLLASALSQDFFHLFTLAIEKRISTLN